MTTPQDITKFGNRLRQLLAATRRRALRHGLVRMLTLGMGTVLLSAWAVGSDVRPSAFITWGLSLSLLGVLVLAVLKYLVRPLRPWRTSRDLALNLERQDDFNNVLVSAEEAGRLPERWAGSHPVRAELLRRLFARANAILDNMAPDRILDLPRARDWNLGLVGVCCLGILLVGVAREDLERGLGRLAKPWPETTLPATGGLYATMNQGFVIAGQDIALSALDFAGGQNEAVCEIRAGSGLWQRVEAGSEPVFGRLPGGPSSHRRWTAVIPQVREDFSWRFVRGAMVTGTGQVTVRHHPLVTGLAARVTPPAYTRLPAREMARVPTWFEVPAGSELLLSGTVNHPVTRAVAVTVGNDTLAMDIHLKGISGTIPVPESLVLSIHLEDKYGLSNQSPLPIEVAAVEDVAPAVSLERLDDDGILPISGELTLQIEAADDFGLARLDLLLRVISRDESSDPDEDNGSWRGGRIWPASPKDWITLTTGAGPLLVVPDHGGSRPSALRVRLDLGVQAGDLDLVAGDAVELVIEARDNKEPGAAGISRSHVLRLVLPSAADVLANQAEASEERRSELEEMQNRSRELDADLDRLTRELMKNPLPDWARQQEMEKAIDRQKTLQDELSRVARDLQAELDRLASSQLTSKAQLDKADEVSELLSQSGSERLNDLLEKMDQAQGQVSPQEVARAMEEVARNQKEMARRLDAALAMLKRMAQEQELEGITALLEKMIQKQQELAELSRQLEQEQAAAKEAGEEGQEGEEGKEGQEGEEGEEGVEGEEGQEGKEGQEGQEGEKGQEGNSDQAEAGEKPEETPTAEELARRQEALAEELEELTEKLEEALEELRKEKAENPDSAGQDQMETALEEALEQLEKQQSESKMSEASEQLMKMDPGQAAEMQEQALRDLGALYHVMIQSQEAMQMAMKMEQVSSLRGLAADMLALSTRQEEIAAMIPADLRDLRNLELSRSQHRVQKAAVGVRNNLAKLMDEAPNRIMKLLKKLDDLIEEMGRSLRGMEENRSQVARQHARQSLASSNRMVISLLTEAQMSGGGGGSASSNPMDSMSEQLKQMAKEQAGLNGATEELRRMLANRGMSQEIRSQMKRLGEEQAGLAGRMNELAEEEKQKERPEGERVLGDIGQMGLDMESIGEEMDDGLVSEETLRRQERILSRMLDARNSVRRRDYTTRRESKTATHLFDRQEGVDGTPEDPDDQRFRLRYQPLEKAPLEYRDLVRRYFTALDSLRRLDDLPPGDRNAPEERDVP